MVSGYCSVCGFPATHRCPDCGSKFCNNCFTKHQCKETKTETVEADITQNIVRKPGRPKVKK